MNCEKYVSYRDAKTAFENSGFDNWDYGPDHTVEEITELVAERAWRGDLCISCATKAVLMDLYPDFENDFAGVPFTCAAEEDFYWRPSGIPE